MRKMLTRIVASAVVAFGLSGVVTAGDFTHDFNTDPTLDGALLFGGSADPNCPASGASGVWRASGSHDGSGYVSLTDAACSQQGKLILPDFDLGAPIESFTARLKIRIGGSLCCGVGNTGPGGTIQPADGFSFNFADVADAAVIGGNAGGWIAGAAEEGTMSGLSVCIDTWDNGGGEAPNIDVKVNGAVVATARVNGNIFRGAEGFLTPRPIINFDPRTGDAWADLEIRLSACGGVTVIYKGVTLFDDIPTGLSPRAGRFLLGARTGGANDNHWIDDLSISTGGDNLSAYVSAKVPSGQFDVPPTTPISFTITERGTPVVPESIKLFVDGTEVAAGSFTVTTETDPMGVTTHRVDHTPASPLAPNAPHTTGLRYNDVFFPGEGPPTCEVTHAFHTSGGTMLFIEAEDFNYERGKHAEFGDPDGSLLNKGTHASDIGIDFNDGSNDDSGQPSPQSYRKATGVEAAKGPNTIGTGVRTGGDTTSDDRGGRAITADWVIGWTGNGEWANYTRTFPNAAYRAFVRWSSGAGAGTPMNIALDEVTTDPALPNQGLSRIGTFNRTQPTGGWDGTFLYTPMLDATGQPALVRLNGKKTLRATVGAGAMDYNFIVFIPDPNAPTIRPSASVSPANLSTTANVSPQIKVVITDRDTAVVASSIKLTVNGTDVTGASTLTDTASGAEITYDNTYGADTVVNATVQWTDNDALPFTQTLSWSFRTGVIAPGTLFIEAEDYNYTEGGVAGLYADFGAPDGSLLNKVGTPLVDYNDPQGNDADDCCDYRPEDGVEAGKGPNNGGDQDRTRGDRTITADWVIGWTGNGEWHNYTRTFPNQRYFVYVRWGSGAAPTDDMAAELGVVTSDPSVPDQTVEKIGDFFRPDATGGWDGFFVYTPLRNSAGELATFKLNGKGTLRYTVRPGAHDVNYLALVPAPPQRSSLASVSPPITREWPNPYAPTVIAVLDKGDTGISSVKLIVDGVERADATVTETDSRVTISVQLPGVEGQRHSASVVWDDGQGERTHTWTFRQGPNYSVDNLFIETEDFNTGGGQYLPSNPSLGHDFNAKGLYNTLGATLGIDYNDSGNCEEDRYRTEGTLGFMAGCPGINGPNIGTVPHNDANRNGAGERPGFEVVTDYKMGWTDAAGDWYNYTRVFPAGNFHVWARLSHGDGNATMGGQLDLVTSDRTQPGQTTQPLGEFVAPASGNWDGFTFVPMTDASGELVTVPSPGGEFTLRYSVKRNGGDLQYLMLTPAANLECPDPIVVGNDAGQCSAVVSFTAQGADSCSPASGSIFPVGVTTVTCTGGGQTCSFTVTVEDREAPTVVVQNGANPGGQVKAKGESSSGFHRLLAADNCDPAPKIYVKDSASSFVSGPYSSGADIKLTTNAGENKTLKGASGLTAHILTAGGAQIYATDSNGNVSAPVSKP